jgi:hypothetical protein
MADRDFYSHGDNRGIEERIMARAAPAFADAAIERMEAEDREAPHVIEAVRGLFHVHTVASAELARQYAAMAEADRMAAEEAAAAEGLRGIEDTFNRQTAIAIMAHAPPLPIPAAAAPAYVSEQQRAAAVAAALAAYPPPGGPPPDHRAADALIEQQRGRGRRLRGGALPTIQQRNIIKAEVARAYGTNQHPKNVMSSPVTYSKAHDRPIVKQFTRDVFVNHHFDDPDNSFVANGFANAITSNVMDAAGAQA